MSRLETPKILVEGQYGSDDLAQLMKKPIWRKIDIYQIQMAELFEIDNPSIRKLADFKNMQAEYVERSAGAKPQLRGNWVYFPWSGELIHTVNAEDYKRLRTNRNKNLITADEQYKLAKFTVGITGLSVGAGIAISLAYAGISGTIKLAEHDNLETSNLNRLRSGINYIGQPKLNVAAQQIYQIDPYANILAWPNGVNANSIGEYLGGKHALNVIFDEIDDFEMKVRLRLAAKKRKVPVIMLTSLGDNILVDIERYDAGKNVEIFNGLLGNLPEEILRGKIGEHEKIKYAMQMVGEKYIPTRALSSLMDINKKLVGRPQLYSTVAAASGLAVFLVKRLALGWPLPSGRSYISFEKALNISSASTDKERDRFLSQLKQLTGKS